jgi:hypothetical protein
LKTSLDFPLEIRGADHQRERERERETERETERERYSEREGVIVKERVCEREKERDGGEKTLRGEREGARASERASERVRERERELWSGRGHRQCRGELWGLNLSFRLRRMALIADETLVTNTSVCSAAPTNSATTARALSTAA